jgi:hypothetical protein
MLPTTRTLLSAHSLSDNAHRSINTNPDISYPPLVRQKTIDRPEIRQDHLARKQRRVGVFAFYTAVASLLVGLALGDRPGTATIASARLGQATGVIDTARHAQ